MNTTNDGGPAFPNTVKISDEAYADLRGMSLRDYFAAKAMQGVIAGHRAPTNAGELRFFAENCYAIADAMLKARSK
jgi:hypothetical protein